MKKILFIILCTGVALASHSCQDFFLEKPDTTGTIDLETVYSNAKDAEATLFTCYREILIHGLPGGGTGIRDDHGMISNVNGELSAGYEWMGTYEIVDTGPNAAGRSTDNFGRNWTAIRQCYLVKENIDKVPDMSDRRKELIKAEATALVAYRYMGMFYRYGGLPIVRRSFTSDDPEIAVPRATLQETLDFIVELCREAYPVLPDSWANEDVIDYQGRLTKGVVLAIEARVKQYAARPLFNATAPVISIGENDDLVCFGGVDNNRWKEAIDANEAVLTWARANGHALITTAGLGNRNTRDNAIADYMRACSELDNPEILLAYKVHKGSWHRITMFYNNSRYQPDERYLCDNTGMLTNFLELYRDQDGGEIDWPDVVNRADVIYPITDDSPIKPTPISVWTENIGKIEARFRADMSVTGLGTAANPDDRYWQPQEFYKWMANYTTNINDFPDAVNGGKGAGFSVKFYHGAGARLWTEIPLFRLAETYLNLAEAYNEFGDTANALKNLNIIRNRAGLPSTTETGQAQLRELIWREKQLEYFNENHRYYDLKHWKHPRIATEIGGRKRELRFLSRNTNIQELMAGGEPNLLGFWDQYTPFSIHWGDRMYLDPIPQTEVNKGIIVQNPGY